MKNSLLTTLLVVPVVALIMSGCTYKTPAVEQPAPVDDADIPKSFFVNSEVNAKTGKTKNVPKKFLCGWASETETGAYAEYFYTNNAIVPEHCNLVFEITESKLIGKLINPSFPDDPTRWEIAITIPIASHYYLEREKDGSGRETNKMVRNSSRSHWSARTHMQLNLDGINLEGVYKSTESYYGMGGGNITTEKVVWDFKDGYLGMTITKSVGNGNYAKIRFNLKEFETNPNFKSTPFNDQNYKKMNVLHIIGEKTNGVFPILRAAHWDVSKKIELRTWGVPEKYKSLVKEVVNDWNEALRQAKATTLTDGPFVVSDTEAEHAFDLRFPTLAWVSDTKVSTYSPLGIGMALADVTNGEIKWGMVTVYSGYMETYMKYGLDTSGSTSSSAMQKMASNLADFLKIQTNIDIPESIRALGYKTSLPQNLSESLAQFFMAQPQALPKTGVKGSADKVNPTKSSPVLTMEEFASQLKSNSTVMHKNLQDVLAQGAAAAQRSANMTKSQVGKLGFSGLIGSKLFKDFHSNVKQVVQNKKAEDGLTAQQRVQNEMTRKYSGPVQCAERTFGDLSPVFAASKNNPAGDEAALRHILKELLSHEFGHFLGLGHQFKESILPAKGTVPDSIYNQLAKKATEAESYTNYSSVMGYRALNTELKDTSEFKPGPHDVLVLRYLYNQEYATFKTGDSDFTFFPIGQDGIIPEESKQKPEYKTSYFPQCNDLQASLAMDPYCNRFDVGPDAVRIVEHYFKEINDTLIQSLYAFTDARGGNADEREMRMWWRSFTELGRVRIFYDYMRKFYRDDFDKIRNDEDAIMQFSESCQIAKTEDIKLSVLRDLFTEKPELKDLCAANALALAEMEKLLALNATDVTKKNPRNQFMPGGLSGGDAERDWSRYAGSWEEMTAYPLKYASLHTLTTPQPWFMWGGMWPHFFYDQNDGYSYMFLYPREYTKIMATNIKKNLKFASLGQSDRTMMGRSVLSMSWLNFDASYGSNDASYFPLHLVSKVRSQQEFNLGLVAVILSGKTREGASAIHTVRWDGQVYDMATDKLTPLNSAYILPGGKVIASSPQMFIYPITQFAPFNAFEGYFFAYKIDYVRDSTDSLSDISVKNDLKDYYTRLYDACVIGTNGSENGLAGFFSVDEPEFEGFLMGKGLERSDGKDFRESIDKAFKKYYEKRPTAKPETCQESLRGLGLIITSAAALNGYWLPEIYDYIQK